MGILPKVVQWALGGYIREVAKGKSSGTHKGGIQETKTNKGLVIYFRREHVKNGYFQADHKGGGRGVNPYGHLDHKILVFFGRFPNPDPRLRTFGQTKVAPHFPHFL